MIFDPLLWMMIGHALCDYPLQGDWLAKAKNHNPRIVLPNSPDEDISALAMLCHCAIHAGAVKLATGSWILAGLEMIAHWFIDLAKCERLLGYNADQLLHVACKFVWWIIILLAVLR
jgi:hypothetical protein